MGALGSLLWGSAMDGFIGRGRSEARGGRTSRGQRKVEPKLRGTDEEDSDDLSRGLRGTDEEEFGAGGGNEPEGCAGK